MPKKGHAIPTSPEWKERVRARLGELGISQNELARRAKIRPSTVSAALAAASGQTTVMAEIHKALGWDPPPTRFAPDGLEALAIYEQLADLDRGELLGEMRAKLKAAKAAAELKKRRNAN